MQSCFADIQSSDIFLLQGTSTIGAVFLIINAALGAGLLNFPQQFHEAGELEEHLKAIKSGPCFWSYWLSEEMRRWLGGVT